jgi:23S rRNA pseudouridine2605 synthase
MKKKTTNNFSKFAPKKSNAAIKEQFKQEKRKFKKEREEFFDKKRSQMSDVRSQKVHPVVSNTQTSNPRPQASGIMPLNKFMAHCGVCGRREAAEMVKQGLVKVNNVTVTEPGHKVSAKDEIIVNGKKIFLAKNLVYILLNKPKDYITTTDDPHGRKTVLDLIGRATTERVYPVGRLDRNTSGVLLFTNDGELAQKLTHPSNEVKKVYHVTLNKPLEKKDFALLLKGVVLDDGPASVDVLAYADAKDKTQIGVEIHSGRNRIVRRIFEKLGYDVRHLDRGKWRLLNEREVRDLKHFGKGK